MKPHKKKKRNEEKKYFSKENGRYSNQKILTSKRSNNKYHTYMYIKTITDVT